MLQQNLSKLLYKKIELTLWEYLSSLLLNFSSFLSLRFSFLFLGPHHLFSPLSLCVFLYFHPCFCLFLPYLWVLWKMKKSTISLLNEFGQKLLTSHYLPNCFAKNFSHWFWNPQKIAYSIFSQTFPCRL